MTLPAQASRPVIDVVQQSDPGRDPTKQINEDACAYRETRLGHLLVVCDGMGGHEAGREASTLAVQTILAMVEGAPEGLSPGQVLKGAIEQAGRAVFQLGGPGMQAGRPGSTVVSLLVHPGGTDVAHVGDSRAYCIRGAQIYPLTRDHSMVQQMIDAGFLRPEEAYGHPDANKITRALGLREATDVELRPEPLLHELGDILLLGTDGLFDVMRPEEALEVVLAAGDLRVAADKLVELANARGGPDNITVQLARVLDPGLRTPIQPANSGRTQIADAPPVAAHPRETVVEPPPARSSRREGPPSFKETLPLGTPATLASGGATISDEAAPVTQRAAPAPTRLDDSLPPEKAAPSHRGGLYFGVAVGAVWLIIAAVALWWLFGRRPALPAADTPDAGAAPVVTNTESPLAPEPAAPAESERPHRMHWGRGPWGRPPGEIEAPPAAVSAVPQAP